MFSTKKFLCLILTIFLLMSFMCACNSSDNYVPESSNDDYESNDYTAEEEDEDEPKISKYEAIEKAKRTEESVILGRYGFNSDARITWGECTAEPHYDGWSVTLRGNIIGTTDLSHSNYRQQSFTEVFNVYDGIY